MKRLTVLILVAVVALSGVFAAAYNSGTGNDSSSWGNGGHPTVPLKFTIGTNTASYKIGFDSNPGVPATPSFSGDVELDFKDGDPTTIVNDSDIYVYWDITTAQGFALSLEAGGALTTGDGGEGKLINFKVTGDKSKQGEVENSDSKEVSITTTAANTTAASTSPIVSQSSATALKSFKGYQKLTIESLPGELDGKATGEYTANLTLKVTDGN